MIRKVLCVFAMFFVAATLTAQTRFLLPYAKIQFFDRNGKPLASGKVYTYVAGTTTPKATYSSATGAANTNPVILDAAGRGDIWLDATASYKIILKDRNDVQQWSVDNITDWGGSLSTGGSTVAGDASGTLSAVTVSKLQGVSVSATAPTEGQVLVYTSGAWTPGGVFPYITFTGPTTSTKTFTLPNASDTVATWNLENHWTKAQTVVPSNLSITPADGTVAVNGSLSNYFRLTLTTDCPCTVQTPTNLIDGQMVTFEITQASGGSETLDWSAAFIWSASVAKPTITATASKKDFITFVYNSTTAKLYALLAVQGY